MAHLHFVCPIVGVRDCTQPGTVHLQSCTKANVALSHYAPMAYNKAMFRFIELTSFSRERDEYFDDDEFALFQRHLAFNPCAGDVIAETGGVRKIRWEIGRAHV